MPHAKFSLFRACLISSGLKWAHFQMTATPHCACMWRTELPDRHHSVFSFSLMVCTEKAVSVMLMQSLVAWKRDANRDKPPRTEWMWSVTMFVCKYKTETEKREGLIWAISFHTQHFYSISSSYPESGVQIRSEVKGLGRAENMNIMTEWEMQCCFNSRQSALINVCRLVWRSS